MRAFRYRGGFVSCVSLPSVSAWLAILSRLELQGTFAERATLRSEWMCCLGWATMTAAVATAAVEASVLRTTQRDSLRPPAFSERHNPALTVGADGISRGTHVCDAETFWSIV